MIYYMQADENKAAYLTTDDSTNGLAIFNNNEKWWDDDTTSGYKLRNGLNVIQIKGSSTISIHNANDDDNVIFGSLDVVKTDVTKNDQGLNLTLLGYSGDGAELLKAISEIDADHEFYYNSIISAAESININSELGETLLSPNS